MHFKCFRNVDISKAISWPKSRGRYAAVDNITTNDGLLNTFYHFKPVSRYILNWTTNLIPMVIRNEIWTMLSYTHIITWLNFLVRPASIDLTTVYSLPFNAGYWGAVCEHQPAMKVNSWLLNQTSDILVSIHLRLLMATAMKSREIVWNTGFSTVLLLSVSVTTPHRIATTCFVQTLRSTLCGLIP